jgi:hypothetical protein
MVKPDNIPWLIFMAVFALLLLIAYCSAPT